MTGDEADQAAALRDSVQEIIDWCEQEERICHDQAEGKEMRDRTVFHSRANALAHVAKRLRSALSQTSSSSRRAG